jgi:hypothetical protein
MHSPQSPVYGKTLARCTRMVYPPIFLRTEARWWASVFLWLWLGHMYMGSKGLPMHSPRSPVYGETLARCTHSVYPLDFSPDGGVPVACVFLLLWLGHMYTGSKGLPILTIRFPPVEAMREFPPPGQGPNHRNMWKVTPGT